jgi:membrane-associated phospholipid phosphatase
MRTLTFWLAACRTGERVIVAYFVYTAFLCLLQDCAIWKKAVAIAVPLLCVALANLETSHGSSRTGIARDWMIPLAVLIAYWQMGWISTAHNGHTQENWLAWDRRILDQWQMRSLIESQGKLIPWFLDLSYLLLYIIPMSCISVLYWQGARPRLDQFLVTFALGTLLAYTLLPFFPVESPRIAFPGQDLPQVITIWRRMSVWILNHLDISTSVFPSGHVAVAFSSAFGMQRALPHRPGVVCCFFAAAMLVFADTIYGRYHYAADGVASLAICVAAWLACEAHERIS